MHRSRGQPFLQWAMDTFRLIVEVVLRPEQTKGFVLVKKRWVVERTFGWWNWYRRLSKDYEWHNLHTVQLLKQPLRRRWQLIDRRGLHSPRTEPLEL